MKTHPHDSVTWKNVATIEFSVIIILGGLFIFREMSAGFDVEEAVKFEREKRGMEIAVLESQFDEKLEALMKDNQP